jgi:VCBS repeat protein
MSLPQDRRKYHLWLLGLGSVCSILVLLTVVFWRMYRQHPPHTQAQQRRSGMPLFVQASPLAPGPEWRAYPLLIDINEDGHLDIVATHRMPTDHNALHIWLGTGTGTFHELPQTWASPGYAGLAAGDINHDGHLDLLAVSHFAAIVTFLGDGTGHFTARTLEKQDGYVAARLLDVDGDGHLDAIVLGLQRAGLEIYLGDGTGQWTLVTQLMQKKIGRDLTLGDVNGDGKLDIVAVFERGVMIYLNDGTGRWSSSPPDAFALPGRFRSVAVGDVNYDGHLDIALNGDIPGPQSSFAPVVYLGNSQGQWTRASDGLDIFKGRGQGIALGDLNNDGYVDLVVGGNVTGAIGDQAYGLFLFTGDGQGHWTFQPDSGLPREGLALPYGIALADLTSDGRLDIVVVHGGTDSGGDVTVWLHR